MTKKFFLIIFAVSAFSLFYFSSPSSVKAQVLPAPTGLSPSNNQDVNYFPVRLSWSPVTGANAGYEYEVRDSSGGVFSGKRFGQSNTSVEINAGALTMGSIMQWQVRACVSFPSSAFGNDGDCGFPSDFASFKPSLSKPQLSSPSNGAIIPFPVELSWGAVSGAREYLYSVGTQKIDEKTVGGNIIVLTSVLAPETKITIPQSGSFTAGGTYYWNIMARPSRGKNSEWSEIRSFTTGFPQPVGVFPSGSVSQPLRLEWTFPVSAGQFKWHILDAKTQNDVYSRITQDSSQKSQELKDLPLERELQWVVQACSTGAKKCGPFSNPLNFKIVMPKPNITQPQRDNQVIASPYNFFWEDVVGALNYIYEIPEVQIRGDAGKATMIQIPKERLTDGLSYTFKVKSCPRAPGDYSDVFCSDWAQRTFTTASLLVSLSANKTSGQAPLEDVKLTASVSGVSTIDPTTNKERTINYTFYCNSDNKKENKTISDGYAAKIDGTDAKTVTAGNLSCPDYLKATCKVKKNESCKYPQAKADGSPYYAKVIVQRDIGLDVAEVIPILVKPTPSGLSVTPDKAKVQFEKTTNFYAKYLPEGKADIKVEVREVVENVTAKAAWSSKNESIAKINNTDKKGEATCINKSGGTVQIEATYQPDASKPALPAQAILTCEPAPVVPTAPALSPEVEKCVNENKCSDKKSCCLWPATTEGYENYYQDIVVYCGGKYESSMCAEFLPYSKEAQPVVDCVKESVSKKGPWTEEGLRQVVIPNCQIYGVLLASDVEKLINEIRAAGGIMEPVTQPTTGGEGGGWFPGIKCEKKDEPKDNELANPLCAENFNDLVNVILNFIFWIAIAVSPIMFIVAGFYFLTSGGDATKVNRGKAIMLWTAIGLAIALFAKGLIAMIKGVLGV